MKFQSPKEILNSNWESLRIKDKEKGSLIGKNVSFVDNNEQRITKEYFNHLSDLGIAELYSVLSALLLQKSINYLSIKNNKIKFTFEDKTWISIDLDNKDISKYKFELINMVTSNYNKTRYLKVNKILNSENKEINFTQSNKNASFFEDDTFYFAKVLEHDYYYYDEEFILDSIKKFLDNTLDEVKFDIRTLNAVMLFDDSPENLAVSNNIAVGLILKSDKNNMFITSLGEIYGKIYKLVENHNINIEKKKGLSYKKRY